MSLASLLHYVSLDGAGGVEQQFVEFLHTAARQSPTEHAVVACGRRVHPLVRERLIGAQVPVTYEKYAAGMKLPKWPPAVRAVRQRSLVRRHRPDTVIIWNRLRDSLATLSAAGPARCIYWERGASWFAGESRAKRVFVDEIQAVLCNSHAAKRMLELRWGYRGQIRVIPNALRPSLRVPHARPRTLGAGRGLRLGMVARLEPIKGVALAIQAVGVLRDRGFGVNLRIAGDGPERARLEVLARRLGLGDCVEFAGLVADMGDFYERIDLLVHPALREPFGQIAVEANAHGVPTIVAAVDGLVEAAAQGQTGFCVEPELPLSDYGGLGGGADDLPPYVYDPTTDSIAAPRLVDPARLADAVEALADDPAAYASMSRQAIAAVAERFDFDVHVRRALAAVDGFVATGRLDEFAVEEAAR